MKRNFINNNPLSSLLLPLWVKTQSNTLQHSLFHDRIVSVMKLTHLKSLCLSDILWLKERLHFIGDLPRHLDPGIFFFFKDFYSTGDKFILYSSFFVPSWFCLWYFAVCMNDEYVIKRRNLDPSNPPVIHHHCVLTVTELCHFGCSGNSATRMSSDCLVPMTW